MSLLVMHGEKGFTLIELMIVILIVGILVGIAVPVFVSAREDTRQQKIRIRLKAYDRIAVPVFVSAREDSQSKVCKSNLRVIKTASVAYCASSGIYPSGVSDLVSNYMQKEPICPAVGDSSAYVVESGGGPDIPVFSCTYHGYTR